MDDLLLASEARIAQLAQDAFLLGLRHGQGSSPPLSGWSLMDNLLNMGEAEWMRFHRTKLRQVYGAGFDIARYTKTALKIKEDRNG